MRNTKRSCSEEGEGSDSDEPYSRNPEESRALSYLFAFFFFFLILAKLFDLVGDMIRPSFTTADCASSCAPRHMSKTTPYSCICALE